MTNAMVGMGNSIEVRFNYYKSKKSSNYLDNDIKMIMNHAPVAYTLLMLCVTLCNQVSMYIFTSHDEWSSLQMALLSTYLLRLKYSSIKNLYFENKPTIPIC